MGDRITFGQLVGLTIVATFLIAVALLGGSATRSASGVKPAQGEVRTAGYAPPKEESSPSPTEPPVDAPPAADSHMITVCIDAEMPIIDMGGDNPAQLSIMGILGGGVCGVEMSGPICWDCDEEHPWHWLVPAAAGQQPEAASGEDAGAGKGCVDASMAARLSGQLLNESDASIVAAGECGLVLGGRQVCWYCREPVPEATPSPAPTPRPVVALWAGHEPQCTDFLTPEVTGREAWEKYGIAEKP